MIRLSLTQWRRARRALFCLQRLCLLDGECVQRIERNIWVQGFEEYQKKRKLRPNERRVFTSKR